MFVSLPYLQAGIVKFSNIALMLVNRCYPGLFYSVYAYNPIIKGIFKRQRETKVAKDKGSSLIIYFHRKL